MITSQFMQATYQMKSPDPRPPSIGVNFGTPMGGAALGNAVPGFCWASEEWIGLCVQAAQIVPPKKIILDSVIVEPLPALPKIISNIVRWFTQ